jgi:hypothetical protein
MCRKKTVYGLSMAVRLPAGTYQPALREPELYPRGL